MRVYAMKCFARTSRAALRARARDSELRSRYDWSRKYAPNRIRVVADAFSGSSVKKKKKFKNEAAHLSP